jgi:hypothetical protein
MHTYIEPNYYCYDCADSAAKALLGRIEDMLQASGYTPEDYKDEDHVMKILQSALDNTRQPC